MGLRRRRVAGRRAFGKTLGNPISHAVRIISPVSVGNRVVHFLSRFTCLLICLAGAQAYGSDPARMEKIKTGILPSGELYSIYEVVCHDQTPANVASLNRGRRWCTSRQGELTCYSGSTRATEVACMDTSVALAEDGGPG
jgi:hypothetical protein